MSTLRVTYNYGIKPVKFEVKKDNSHTSETRPRGENVLVIHYKASIFSFSSAGHLNPNLSAGAIVSIVHAC